MKQVLLSADGPMALYSVPDPVAARLEQYCLEFSEQWIWHTPAGAGLLRQMGGRPVAVYDADDFIRWLNDHRFPGQPSALVARLDFYADSIPPEYGGLPSFSF